MTFLEMALSGTVMILAAAALRAMTLRRLPKGTFVALWWLTAVRLLAPVKLPSRFSVYTLLEYLRREAAPTVPAAPAAQPYAPARVAVIPGPSETASAPFPVWKAVWLAGTVLLALWFLVRYIRWLRRFRESSPVDCPYVRSWRRVQLRVTDRIGAPLTYGFLRPVILLPRTLDLTDEEAVSCVLAHEMSHIRRLDSLFKLVLAAALCLHWFNPAVWLLYVLANRDMELRCDEAAVLSLGEDSRARYALALIRLAEQQNEYMPLCGFSHKSGMEERIQAIMTVKKKSLPACFFALALVLGLTTAFATSAKPAPSGEDLTDAQETAWKALGGYIQYDRGRIYFSIPEGDGRWSIFIRGRIMTEDGMGMSVHYLEEESERGEWVPGETYSFEVADAAYDELVMDMGYGNFSYSFDLTRFLPESEPMVLAPLSGNKTDIPEGADMIWPVDSDQITSAFGSRNRPGGNGAVEHSGIDIRVAESGAPIYAAAKGIVKDTGYNAENGNYVRLDHGDGLETFYAHCQSVLVKTGGNVALGQTIATVGSTGKSTGPHLHFEILMNGVVQDPEAFYRDLLAGVTGEEVNTDLPADAPELRIGGDSSSETAPVLVEYAPRQGNAVRGE